MSQCPLIAWHAVALRYPPIHQHHYHLIYGTNMWRQALNAHGDGECLDGQRQYCMLKE